MNSRRPEVSQKNLVNTIDGIKNSINSVLEEL